MLRSLVRELGQPVLTPRGYYWNGKNIKVFGIPACFSALRYYNDRIYLHFPYHIIEGDTVENALINADLIIGPTGPNYYVPLQQRYLNLVSKTVILRHLDYPNENIPYPGDSVNYIPTNYSLVGNKQYFTGNGPATTAEINSAGSDIVSLDITGETIANANSSSSNKEEPKAPVEEESSATPTDPRFLPAATFQNASKVKEFSTDNASDFIRI